MGLITAPKHKPESELSKEELQFILTKLKDASFKGHEFETYFTILKKITDHIVTLS